MVGRSLKYGLEYGSKFKSKQPKIEIRWKVGWDETQLWEVIAVQKWIPCPYSPSYCGAAEPQISRAQEPLPQPGLQAFGRGALRHSLSHIIQTGSTN